MHIEGDRSKVRIAPSVCTDSTQLFFVAKAGTVTIEEYALVGYGCRFLSGWHNYRLRGSARHPETVPEGGMDILIRSGAWLASFVTVCGPCVVGEDAVVGAGSVVTSDVPAGELWAGSPARFIRKIDFID